MSSDNGLKVLLLTHWKPILQFTIASLCLAVTYGWHTHVQEQKNTSENTYQSQARRNSDAASALSKLTENYGKYQAYIKKGVIGESNRLQQFELLDRLAEQLSIPSIVFSMGKSRYATSSSYYIWDQVVHLKTSLMRLELTTQNESQFQQFMDALNHYAPGLASMQSCEMRRAVEGEITNPVTELKTICELEWYNLKDITTEWGANDLAQN